MIYEQIKAKEFYKGYRLTNQITGAGISVMNNIAEGFDSHSNKELVRFLRISRRSISEAQKLFIYNFQLEVCKQHWF
ncbi:MAG: four helix bundle protein [Candidatus Omnitrophica bacterium]|nr:four helix bundle protein [Candidatus Omnitrophota bacterium]